MNCRLGKGLRDSYSSPSVIENDEVEEDEMGGACSMNEEKEERV
jgi:hypothetical protein